MAVDNEKYILEMNHISKSFVGVQALDDVTMKLRPGTVMALMGENGAGKSTLIKVLTGVHAADGGELLMDGEPVTINNPRDAFEKGINVVHQERNLFTSLNVAENIFIEEITRKSVKVLDVNKYLPKAQKYLDMVGLDISPDDEVSWLSAGKQQLIEIARALSAEARIIVLDEPTASISIVEANNLLKLVNELKAKGYSFIFVSHKMEEVFAIADDICVIRDGKGIKTFENVQSADDKEKLRDEVITAMIGRSESKESFAQREVSNAETVLKVSDWTSRDRKKPAEFSLKKGEILGWYGMVGSGRTELVREIIGANSHISGTVEVYGEPAKIKNPQDAIQRYNMAYLSELRNTEGVFMGLSVSDNIASSILNKISNKLGFINLKKQKEISSEYIEKLAIKTPTPEQLVSNLSGGNRQKVSIAKGLAMQPTIVFIDEPTVGIDIATKEEIYKIVWDLAENGMSIVFISSDLKELISIADRVLVFNEYRICGDIHNTKVYSEMSEKIMTAIQDDISANLAEKE